MIANPVKSTRTSTTPQLSEGAEFNIEALSAFLERDSRIVDGVLELARGDGEV